MAACYKSSNTTMTDVRCLYRQGKHHQHFSSFTTSSHSPSCAAITNPSTMVIHLILSFLTVSSLTPEARAIPHSNVSCRSYCGNLTVDYPFALRFGCGHPGFRDLLFCINDYLMLHLPSGSYRVLDIDYSFHSLTLHDPHLSDCLTLFLGRRANGFSLEPWRTPYLSPVPDNAFLLLGCSARSPLFQGFPTRRLPCRNVSGISCEEYYQCPGWSTIGVSSAAAGTRWGPPECCALPFQAIREINLSKLECEGYSSAYSLAPLKVAGPHEWSYGIRVKYSVQGSEEFCRACEATGGTCGFGGGNIGVQELCMCDGFNSTTNCDSVGSSSHGGRWSPWNALSGFVISILPLMASISIRLHPH